MHHLLECLFMSKIGYFHHVKNKIDKLAFNKKIEMLWLMIAVTSR